MAETARYRLGPVRFTPSIELADLGIDDNVFNETVAPRRDTTAAAGPAVDWWARLGRSRVSARTVAQYLYFAKFANQRAWNTVDNVRWELPMGRVMPFVVGEFSNTRQRPGFEIDARARARQVGYGLGTDIRLSGKTTLVVAARRTELEFDESVFLGTSLATALNRHSDEGQVQLRFRLTPLTTLAINTSVVSDRFQLDSIRDADSVNVTPGFEFKPFALISGKVFVGYRRFAPLNAAVPAYQGVVSSVAAAYVLRATRIEARVNRDVTYSYDAMHPYYMLTDLGLAITRRFGRSWEVAARGGRQGMSYADLRGASQNVGRVDRGDQIGGGIGYFVGDTLRVGFDVNHFRRLAPSFNGHEYAALRAGASVSYGVRR